MKFDAFFDRPEIIGRVSRKQRRVLSRTGAYAMGVMRNLLSKRAAKRVKVAGNGRDSKGRFTTNRKRLGVSRQGEPPRQVVGLLRKRTFFAFDRENDTVVIGPEVLPTANHGNTLHGVASVPQLLNEGGRETLQFLNGRRETVTYEPRPFTEPTYEPAEKFFRDLIQEEPL